MIRRVFAVAVLIAASSCGHQSDTQTTTTAVTAAPAPRSAAAPETTAAPGISGGSRSSHRRGASRAGEPAGFDTDEAAQAHCPSDEVVWVNTRSRIYHLKGTTYYGHTKQGTYACRKEADAAGDRDSKS